MRAARSRSRAAGPSRSVGGSRVLWLIWGRRPVRADSPAPPAPGPDPAFAVLVCRGAPRSRHETGSRQAPPPRRRLGVGREIVATRRPPPEGLDRPLAAAREALRCRVPTGGHRSSSPSKRAAYTSPRFASISGSRGPAGIPAASAASDDTPRSGRSFALARARAVATPMRRPVNVPGPTPTAIASRSREADARPLHHVVNRGHQLRGVRRPLGQPRRRRRDLDQLIPAQDGGRRGGGGGVEAEDRHSISIVRLSPPACSSRTRWEAASSGSGHSTKAIRSGVT